MGIENTTDDFNMVSRKAIERLDKSKMEVLT